MDPLQPQVPPSPAPAMVGQEEPVFDSAPESPMGVPGVEEEALSQEQMKTNLQELMAKIQEKMQTFGNSQVAVGDKEKKQRSEALRGLFDLFESAGIDPGDPAAVDEFLNKLKETNPELHQQLIQALQVIMGGDAPEEQPMEQENVAPENMNINPNENVSQNI